MLWREVANRRRPVCPGGICTVVPHRQDRISGAAKAKARSGGRLKFQCACPSLRNTATAQELLNARAAHGGPKWNHPTMVRALEKSANHEVAK